MVIPAHSVLTVPGRYGQGCGPGIPDLTRDLLTSARAAAAARTTWLAAAQAWSRITTDTRGTISLAAAEAADLALWIPHHGARESSLCVLQCRDQNQSLRTA